MIMPTHLCSLLFWLTNSTNRIILHLDLIIDDAVIQSLQKVYRQVAPIIDAAIIAQEILHTYYLRKTLVPCSVIRPQC